MTNSKDRLDSANNHLDRIEATLEKLSSDLTQIREGQTQMREDQDRGCKLEDRTWDVVEWVDGISAALSISAAIALVGIVFRLALTERS